MSVFQIEINEKVDSAAWNNLVASVPEGTIFQTTYWADYLNNTGFCCPFFCSVKDNNQTKGILLFWVENLNNRSRNDNKIASLLGACSRIIGASYIYWFYGPLILDKTNEADILNVILKAINDFSKDKKITAIKSIGEPVYYGQPGKNGEHNSVYKKSGYRCQDKATLFINLPANAQDYWDVLKKYTRKDILSCQKQSLLVEFLDEQGLDEYKDVIIENTKRVKAGFPPYYPDKNMWNALRKQRKSLEVMVIKKDNKILGGMGIVEFNGIVFNMTSCQSDESYSKKININDLLVWEVIKWSIANGKRIYDLTGIPLKPKNKKEEGLRNFKMKWSDKLQIFPSFERSCNKPLTTFIDLARNFV